MTSQYVLYWDPSDFCNFPVLPQAIHRMFFLQVKRPFTLALPTYLPSTLNSCIPPVFVVCVVLGVLRCGRTAPPIQVLLFLPELHNRSSGNWPCSRAIEQSCLLWTHQAREEQESKMQASLTPRWHLLPAPCSHGWCSGAAVDLAMPNNGSDPPSVSL